MIVDTLEDQIGVPRPLNKPFRNDFKSCWVERGTFVVALLYWLLQYWVAYCREAEERKKESIGSRTRLEPTAPRAHGMRLKPLISTVAWFKDDVNFSPLLNTKSGISYFGLGWVKLVKAPRETWVSCLLCWGYLVISPVWSVEHASLLDKISEIVWFTLTHTHTHIEKKQLN